MITEPTREPAPPSQAPPPARSRWHHHRRRRHPALRVLRIVSGILLILIGIPELFLPGPGLLFILAGLSLLSTEVRPVRMLFVTTRRRWRLWRRSRR